MQATIERKRASKAVAVPMSKADKELADMKAYMKKVSRSKKSATEFLLRGGVIDKNGVLAEHYRS
jgi:hypothetical protein